MHTPLLRIANPQSLNRLGHFLRRISNPASALQACVLDPASALQACVLDPASALRACVLDSAGASRACVLRERR